MEVGVAAANVANVAFEVLHVYGIEANDGLSKSAEDFKRDLHG